MTGAGAAPPAIVSAMRAAIAESRTVLGTTAPNPPVGAAIVDPDGRIVGLGATRPPGGAHAEVMALAAAGERARGATAVVTLEPCDHIGRTGPCSRALIAAGVTTVYYAVADPSPQAAGGADTLRAGGVRAHAGLLADEVRAGPLAGWLFRLRHDRPRVTAKIAATVDGRVAAPDGSSRWITGPAAREHAHRIRAELDAIVVGTGTVLRDDPALTARSADGTLLPHQPTRVVLGDRHLPPDARILGPEARTVLVSGHDVTAVLDALPDAADVLIEGGPTVVGAFLTAGLVDRVHAYLAPMTLGSGFAAVSAPAVTTLTDGWRMRRTGLLELDEDILLTLEPTR
ncbi:bifunctional diaminohydroxyphosphoribosylaminopyrimidine deaminase/5-amino-6-(5-phosphoribosylamino)uracil reductase RibD [Williamsia sterculiae]|uniref:Riboflavin biosynthesis protein RibD n=1 Tax=Williamsia sterculiae TaxID=1344003 RepID=A0A1N7EIG3_9NOCA|nr:bifunctional diaminohydroxyphosphoribosylaminopyrimidine deaminase/5-amino-6-(5-phosphoribosylamino)uracil reductase RibD [Williamsia sterculiae]SIR87870.1 diaminohydroxyphosphoribosylaminopyrimidine deaminase [Williamsia sterculiae]